MGFNHVGFSWGNFGERRFPDVWGGDKFRSSISFGIT